LQPAARRWRSCDAAANSCATCAALNDCGEAVPLKANTQEIPLKGGAELLRGSGRKKVSHLHPRPVAEHTRVMRDVECWIDERLVQGHRRSTSIGG